VYGCFPGNQSGYCQPGKVIANGMNVNKIS
jgi:aerobic-type carbon monoxide dehydrogenase small subunit (CoxS/CutS family)